MPRDEERNDPCIQEGVMAANKDAWCKSLAGKHVGKFTLVQYVGAGRIGYVYKAQLRDLPSAVRAVKLTFDTLRDGWDVELRKVLSLHLVDGIVHFHDHGAETIAHEGSSRLCQFTVWDYVSPGENLKKYLARVGKIDAGFLIAVVER